MQLRLNCRIQGHLFTSHCIRIASIVLRLVHADTCNRDGPKWSCILDHSIVAPPLIKFFNINLLSLICITKYIIVID